MTLIRPEAATIRIIQVTGSDLGGGAETVARLHHEELRRQGHEVQLLVGRKQTADPDVTQIPYRRGPKGLLRATRWLERKTGLQNLYSPSFRRLSEAFRFEPDVIHFHSLHGVDGFAELSVLRKLSQKYTTVVSLHDFWLMTGHCGHPLSCEKWASGCGRCPDLSLYPAINRDATAWNFRRKRWLFAQSRLHLIVPSTWLAEQVQSSPILNRFPVSVVGNPVDTTVFRPRAKEQVRSRLGLRETDQIVLLIAQHLTNPYKGMQLGIEALNRCKAPGLTVVVVGHSTSLVAAQLTKPVIEVPFASDSDHLAALYSMADVVAVPSRGETFGLVAAEAMACGTPVVAFGVGGLTDVVGNNEGGVLVAAEDAGEFAASIDRLLGDSDLTGKLSIGAISRVGRLFGLAQHSQKCVKVYSDAA